MKSQHSQSFLTTVFTLCIFSISQPQVHAAPGTLGKTPLFVAAPVQPNVFFLLDDSGSMNWTMPTDGGQSQSNSYIGFYHTRPGDTTYANSINNNIFGVGRATPLATLEWNTWCLGANHLAYNPNATNDNYKPWVSNIPGTTTPFPDQTDITNVRVDPLTSGGSPLYNVGEDSYVLGDDDGTIDLSGAPVVRWDDANGNGQYDAGECPNSYADAAGRVQRADQLTSAQQTNFANWFSYYRIKEHTAKAAITQIISKSSARVGMATINHNAGALAIQDMTDPTNRDALLQAIVTVDSTGGTPLRRNLNDVGRYFNEANATPTSLGISTASADKPINSASDGGECQQNFTMLMTDGFWNGGTTSFPAVALSSSASNQDGTVDNNFVYPAHQDALGNTLADVAMFWYKTDLSTLTDRVQQQLANNNTTNWEENPQQHMVTFGIAFGASGTLNASPTDRSAAFAWPTPVSSTLTTVDDLRHAAYNSRGSFLSANRPESLITELETVFSEIESRKGSAAAVSFNTQILTTGSLLFFASFDTKGWVGDVEAYSVNPSTGKKSSTPLWSAAAKLDGLADTDMANRTIYTWGLDSSGTKNGTLFEWNTSTPQPTVTILDDLKINQDTSIETLASFPASQVRLNFVRGDKSNDGIQLIRDRKSRLGDITHSAPHFVGAPISDWPDKAPFGTGTSKYSSYQSASTRAGVVYVGANDGLLHGFKEKDGVEIFAYLPSATASTSNNAGLHYLSEIDYQHRFYVDGSPISADVYIPITTSGTKAWRTILVGGLGGGGQGIYALDVTDPTTFNNTEADAKNTVLWEFTSQDDSSLGYSFSKPQITMMNNDQWAVIFGNGYNATGTDYAQLKILFIEEGLDGVWTSGTDFITLDTEEGTVLDPNGLSTPTLIDLDGNGTTDRIYAGDLHGNMWAFDVSGDNVTSGEEWKIAHGTALNPEPLFTAENSAVAQPITMQPLLVKPDPVWIPDDAATNSPNIMVYFGTGQYIATADATDTKQQSFYGVWDAGVTVPKAKLVEQTFAVGFPTDARVLTQNAVNFPKPPELPATVATSPSLFKLGWFIDLPESGERVTVNAFKFSELIFFNTLTPSSDACKAGGESWRMAVDMQTGGNPTKGAFDRNADGVFDGSDKVSDGTDSYFSAGKKFDKGIASETIVMRNNDGKAFSTTSQSGTAFDDGETEEELMNTDVSGRRESWIQLFN